MVLFICEKRLEHPCGLKWKLLLLKGSLVRLQLHRTWRHQSDHLLLLFHVTSAMMPHAWSIVTPLPVWRQNWKTLAWLASHQSNYQMSMHVLTPYSSAHRFWDTNRQTSSNMILRHKSRNRRGDFEAQITKLSTLVLRLKPRNRRSGFKAKLLTNRWPWFWGPNQEIIVVVLRSNHWQTVATSFEAKLRNLRFSSLPRVDPCRCPPCRIYQLHIMR
jgi:hypothetical protein